MGGELQKAVGRNFREHRKGLSLTQEEFAAQYGFHRTFVSALERGERNLTLQTVERIADRLGIEPRALLKY